MDESNRVDYRRMTGNEYSFGVKSIITLLTQPQIRYMRWWRGYKYKRSIVKRLFLLRYAHKYGLEISCDASIGKGLYLGHPYNITVGKDVTIGDNVNLHKGCTIGIENRGHRKGAPTIGDCVYIGINATIVGNIRIGSDVVIAPGSFVNFDVPDHSVVIGNPGIVHHKENATDGYIAFRA